MDKDPMAEHRSRPNADDDGILEFVLTETDENGRETTWSWDGNRWTRLA